MMPTSKLVPPTSAVITLRMFKVRANVADAVTPPAGPEFRVANAWRPTCSLDITPPLHSMMRGGASKPSLLHFRAIESTWRTATGPIYALTTVAVKRSYSPILGAISWEHER
jgi:hypothetical protein